MTTQPIDTSSLYVGQPMTPRADRLGTVPRWKRACDLILGGLALVLLSPIILAAAVLVRLSGPGPVLFRQPRIGRGEQPFIMFKFRTMYVGSDTGDADKAAYLRELNGEAVPEAEGEIYRPARDPRITPVGRWLRQLSIDELPQLLNVLGGDMSLVGPRPNLPWEAELLNEQQRRRYQVLPGITGLWQVSGRNRRDTRDMLALDVRYVEQCSPSLDLAILLRTPRAVLFDRHTR